MSSQVTAWGEKHGLINTVSNSVEDNGFKHLSPELKKKAEALRKEESRLVKARYINHRGKHERLTKPYMRYAGDPIQTWHLIPDHVYELPLGLVNEINDPSKRMPIRSEICDATGVPTTKDAKGEAIHELVPVGF